MKLRLKNDFLTTYIVRNELPVDFLPIWKFKSGKILSTYISIIMMLQILLLKLAEFFQNYLINPIGSRADDFAYSYFLQL